MPHYIAIMAGFITSIVVSEPFYFVTNPLEWYPMPQYTVQYLIVIFYIKTVIYPIISSLYALYPKVSSYFLVQSPTCVPFVWWHHPCAHPPGASKSRTSGRLRRGGSGVPVSWIPGINQWPSQDPKLDNPPISSVCHVEFPFLFVAQATTAEDQLVSGVVSAIDGLETWFISRSRLYIYIYNYIY